VGQSAQPTVSQGDTGASDKTPAEKVASKPKGKTGGGVILKPAKNAAGAAQKGRGGGKKASIAVQDVTSGGVEDGPDKQGDDSDDLQTGSSLPQSKKQRQKVSPLLPLTFYDS
jgi:hypothetical protein